MDLSVKLLVYNILKRNPLLHNIGNSLNSKYSDRVAACHAAVLVNYCVNAIPSSESCLSILYVLWFNVDGNNTLNFQTHHGIWRTSSMVEVDMLNFLLDFSKVEVREIAFSVLQKYIMNKNKSVSPFLRTAALCPCIPPPQKTGSTPILS